MNLMKYAFFLVMLACTPGNAQEIKTLFIADHLVDCTGVAPQKCMLVKEREEDSWRNFYYRIEGFSYEEGFAYELRVRVLPVENPPADASSLRYVLEEVVTKTPSDRAATNTEILSGTWKVIHISGLDSLNGTPTFEFKPDLKRVAGSTGCNNYFASYELRGEKLKLGHSGVTQMACPDMSVENAFVQKLDLIAYFKRIKRELHLFDAKDNLLMIALQEQ